jgi:hypothetical protein
MVILVVYLQDLRKQGCASIAPIEQAPRKNPICVSRVFFHATAQDICTAFVEFVIYYFYANRLFSKTT